MKKEKFSLSRLMLALLAAFSLLLSGCGAPSAPTASATPTPPSLEANSVEHQQVAFADMAYVRPDLEALDQKIADCQAMAAEEDKESELLAMYGEILDDIRNLDAMDTLATIHYNLDTTDTYYEEEMTTLDNYYTRLDNKMNELTETILASGYQDAAKAAWGDAFIERYEFNSKLNSPEIEALSEQENDLVTQYTKLLASDYTTELNGQTVTVEDLDLNTDEGIQAYTEIYEKKNAELGGIYLQLRDLRIQIAQTLGYDSYTDYAYDVLGRDYTPEDARNFSEKVRTELLPAFGQMINANYNELVSALTSMQSGNGDLEAVLPILKTSLQKEFPSKMSEALDYMQNNKLYDFSNEPNKMHAGYTTFINDYSAPFMFINSNDYRNADTVIHEFGHYYNFYLMPTISWNDSNNLDAAEIHSQALELLMQPYYDQFFGADQAEGQKIYSIYNMLSSILQGCAEDEFQQAVFANPDLTLEEVNQLHSDIFYSYTGNELYYEWVEIHHHFETPFYYISYATSAISALEIWAQSVDDRAKALSTYNQITQYTVNFKYRDALVGSGLKDPFTSDCVSEIAEKVKGL